MCFHSARSQGRLSDSGELILLADQDRSMWNKDLIMLGNDYMNLAAFGHEISHFHYEAAISYEHCIAKNYHQTNWKQILLYYNAMLEKDFNPVIALNRSVVILQLHGAEMALRDIHRLEQYPQLTFYYLYYLVLAEIYSNTKEKEKTLLHYQKALHLTQSDHEKKLIQKKMKAISEQL